MSKLAEISILFIDNEKDLPKALNDELAYEGATVTNAGSRRLGLEWVKSNKYEVVISDIRMPDGVGITLLKSIRAKVLELPIFFLGTAFTDTTSEEAKKLGAIEVLRKLFNIDKIILKIFKLKKLKT